MSDSTTRPRTAWTVFVAFALAGGIMLVFIWQPLYLVPSESIPQSGGSLTLPKLAEHIRKKYPKLHIIPASNSTGNLEAGFYVSRRKMTFNEASWLVCQPEFLDMWHGVVFCQRSKLDSDLTIAAREIAAWGEGGWRNGRIMIVGDPELIRDVLEAEPRHVHELGKTMR